MEFKNIRKWGLLVLLSALFQTGAVFADDTPVEQKTVELRLYKKAVPVIEARASRRRQQKLPLSLGHGTCSGAFVSPLGDILTAKHCVDDNPDIEVVTSDGRTYKAVIVATSTVHDLAMIHIDRRGTPYFNLAQNVTRGQSVFVLGSPLAITDVLATGIVARIDGDQTFLDCSALPGNSGGPVFDQDGNLVGIVTSVQVVMLGLTHLSAAQGLDAVSFFLIQAFEKATWFK